MKPFIAFSFIIALTACAHTHPRLSGTGTQYQIWQAQVVEECARKAATITVELMEEKAKQGMILLAGHGYAINRYVLELCYKRNRIVI